MTDLLTWLETSGVGTWIRESPSIWAYPTVLFLHTFGLTFVVGVNAAIDLRVLGFGEGLPLEPMRSFFPVMWIGFWVNALSGIGLTIADATTKLSNPVFYVKLVFIALAVVNIFALERRVFRQGDGIAISAGGRVLAASSLVCWAGAITAGRLMAYIGPVSGMRF